MNIISAIFTTNLNKFVSLTYTSTVHKRDELVATSRVIWQLKAAANYQTVAKLSNLCNLCKAIAYFNVEYKVDTTNWNKISTKHTLHK